MASACAAHLSLAMASLRSPLLSRAIFNRPISLHPFRSASKCGSRQSASIPTSSFTWDDVLRVSHPQYSDGDDDDPSDLAGFFEKIRLCNRGPEMQNGFFPFVVEDQIVGYVHYGFADHLRRFDEVFTFNRDDFNGSRSGGRVGLHPSLETPEDRTEAVACVVKCLGRELIPGIRNELYPVKSSFGGSIIFSLERAAAPYFGIKAYGVHMNGYVEKDGQEYLWIAKRSQVKPTFPGMLDHLVAGGLPHDIACGENLIKECEEEAGIPRIISCGTSMHILSHLPYAVGASAYIGFTNFMRHHSRAIPVGAVSYMDIDGFRYKRDVLFCYDLKLPEDFTPNNQDGEVESFKLIPVAQVANVIRRTEFFKPNCALVITDFLFRHGYIKPESIGYLELLRSLKSGDCS